MFGDKPKSLPQHVALILVPEFTMIEAGGACAKGTYAISLSAAG